LLGPPVGAVAWNTIVSTPPLADSRQVHSPSARAFGTTNAQVACSETTSPAPRALTQVPIGGGPARAGVAPASSKPPSVSIRNAAIVPLMAEMLVFSVG